MLFADLLSLHLVTVFYSCVCNSVCGMSGASLLLALLRLLLHPKFIIFSGNAQLENKYQKSHVMHH